ncbi:MAG: VanZ family protein [Flavobacteriaceae bacterium]|nr:VanZ family protein [Flavobacteriaceae bacterium]
MLKRYVTGTGFVGWMVGITILSLVSFEDETSLDLEIPYLDKIVHFTFYFIAAVLGLLFYKSLNERIISNFKRILIFLAALIVYGIIIEVLQSTFTTYRSGEITDVLANSAGALLGTFLIRAIFSGKTESKWEN